MRNLKIRDAVASRALAVPGRTALVTDDLELTTTQLLSAAHAAAGLLAARGVHEGQTVVVLARDPLLAAVLAVAASEIGADLAPLNVRLAGAELADQVRRLRPAVVVSDPSMADTLSAGDESLPTLVTTARELSETAPAPFERSTRDGAVVMFTSGTTGQPKGVHLHENGLMVNALVWACVAGMGMDDAYGNGFPLFHVGGFVGLLPSLILGAPTYMPPVGGFDGEDFVRRSAAIGATHIGLVPSQLVMLARRDVAPQESVRAVITGGAPPTATTLDAVRTVFPAARYVNAFGQTELSGNVAYGIFDEAPTTPTIGQVQPLSTYTTRDAVGGQELLVQSPALFASYLIGDDVVPGPEVGQWHATGDLVTDDGGELTISGRASDLIISGGENIRPEEVATVIDAVDGVLEVAVVGSPDETWGEVPVAFVAPRKGTDADDLLARIRAAMDERLARYKIPRRIVLLDDMPRTGTGKVDRQNLKEVARR